MKDEHKAARDVGTWCDTALLTDGRTRRREPRDGQTPLSRRRFSRLRARASAARAFSFALTEGFR